MANDNPNESVYGENVGEGSLTDERGIREETVEAHPQPTGDAAADPEGVDAASEVRTRGAEAIEGSEGSPEDDLEAVRQGASSEAGSGGMGREGTPSNQDGTPQGQFTQPSPENKASPG